MDNLSNPGYLDKLRYNKGTYKVKSFVKKLGETNRKKLIYFMNDKKMTFSSLFILLPEIETFNLYNHLSQRNRIALRISAKVMLDDALTEKLNGVAVQNTDNPEEIHNTLKWMFNTGYQDDGLNDNFDEVLDATVALLIKTHDDKSILPNVVKMIFNRHRKGLFKHDLIWAFFESRDPYALKLIANYLRSSDKKDVELASELLDYNNSDAANSKRSPSHKYSAYLAWLKENYPFIYFTGESFQLMSRPMPWRVNLGHKYLCKNSKYGNIASQEEERSRLEIFNQLDDEDQRVLSQYSYKLHNKNIRSWNQWIKYPLRQQTNIAKTSLGGMS